MQHLKEIYNRFRGNKITYSQFFDEFCTHLSDHHKGDLDMIRQEGRQIYEAAGHDCTDDVKDKLKEFSYRCLMNAYFDRSKSGREHFYDLVHEDIEERENRKKNKTQRY